MVDNYHYLHRTKHQKIAIGYGENNHSRRDAALRLSFHKSP